MPLLAHAVIAYAGGLAAGLAGSLAPAVLAGVALLVAAMATRRSGFLAWGCAGIIGALIGQSTRAEEQRCGSTVATSRVFEIQLSDDADAGVYARGVIDVGACEMPGGVALTTGSARAGDRIRVHGRPLVDGRRVRVLDARVLATSPGSVASRWRSSTGASLDTLFGP